MNWLNISVETLTSDQFISASLEQRGAWLGILKYCITQENGGEIIKCTQWTDLHWIQACGVTTSIVKAPSPLWNWNGDCLRVVAYPWDMEKMVKRKREVGKKCAERRWEKQLKLQEFEPKKALPPKLQVLKKKAI